MSVRTKQGLGLNKYIGEGELGIDDSVFSIFYTNSDELEGQPIYKRFALVDHMMAVPPPLTGNYMPPSNIPDIDESQMVYGKKATDSSEIKTNDDSISHSHDSILFYFSDRHAEGKGILGRRPTGKPVNSIRPKPVSVGQPNLVFAGHPNPISAGQSNPVSAGQPNPISASQPNLVSAGKSNLVSAGQLNLISAGPPNLIYAGQPNPVSTGDGLLGPRPLNNQPPSNKDKLDDFEDFDGGEVTFGGSTGKISGKGTIKTKTLNFKNVLYVEELQHFNLISVSQICDQTHRVLFTKNECLVLSKDFPLPDPSMGLPESLGKDKQFIFLVDFVVLEMDEDELVLIILGRPFLATTRAVIDVHKGKLSLIVENETVTFNIKRSMKSKHSHNDYLYCTYHTAKLIRKQWVDKVDHDGRLAEVEEEGDSNKVQMVSFYHRLESVKSLAWKALENRLKPPSVEPPKLELNELPEHLEFTFLQENNQLPVVISSALSIIGKPNLLEVQKNHKGAITGALQT
nr:hypothetical protein [Tanacetum cinerariifolium]